MKTAKIHIGCSAFNTFSWKGIFYPENLPRTKWFDFYAQQLGSYELNATFYRTPTVKSLQSWYNKTPADFLFSVKAPRNVTHYKRFVGCEQELADFYSLCRDGLKEKLACVLFQMPPSFAYSDEKLDLIVRNLNADFKNVIEFRNESWWQPTVYETLQNHNITFCNVSYPKLPESLVKTNHVGYVRLHGRTKLFYSGYSDLEIEQLMESIQASGWDEVFVYFNNTADVHGILNAIHLKSLK